MPLPHFTQLINTGSPGGPGTLPDEVVYLNLFEITFVLPVILQAQGRNPILLLQNALKIPVYVVDDPLSAVARGTGVILDDIESYKDVLIGNQDELPPR